MEKVCKSLIIYSIFENVIISKLSLLSFDLYIHSISNPEDNKIEITLSFNYSFKIVIFIFFISCIINKLHNFSKAKSTKFVSEMDNNSILAVLLSLCF